MDDLLSEFLTETNENIGIVDASLVVLEQDPGDESQIGNIFRLVHTIKGTCGFLGLPRLEAVAHAGENVLGKIRDRELTVTAEVITIILEAMDVIKDILGALEETEAEPAGNDSDLINRLNDVAFKTGSLAADAAQPVDESNITEEALEAAFQQQELRPGEVSLEELEAAFQAAEGPEDIEPVLAQPAGNISGEEEVELAVEKSPKGASIANQSIRVNVQMLERLMTMVSELVLTRNQLMQMVRGMGDNEFTVPLQRLSHVTTELQEGLMKTRMQPIGNAWSKLPRIVRDLSHELGKKIDLVMQGAETELDRQVLELIKDPLTHMVRNSADHGLEPPEERAANGKAERGRIILNAFHEGGHIIVTIVDDGRGLNCDKITKKLLETGLATENEIAGMSTQHIHNFIMRPGFSTADKVTNVSGRGVGMDVVRSNIEKIGGTIALTSEEGVGSTFTIKIPLTLAIVSALIVECCGERFAIPQTSVIELVRTSNTAGSGNIIEMINDTPVFRLRDHLLPLIYLNEVLRLETAADEIAGQSSAKGTEEFIIVTQLGNSTFGIVVDQVFDTEEIVVKPIAPILKNLAIFSGNTILGDGSVIMILDPNGIATLCGDAMIGENHAVKEDVGQIITADDTTALLVFRAGGVELKAVPLSLVARLEEIDVQSIETANGRMVVQYREQLMPLVKAEDNTRIPEKGRQPILVFNDQNRIMGLIVDEIVDIVEDRLNIEISSNQDGYIGSAIVREKATDILDIGYFLKQCFGDWFNRQDTRPLGRTPVKQKVLLVDDSPFFRNMLVPLLTTAGYDVSTAENGSDALELRDHGKSFDIIISDIEMPVMDGFQFAEAVLGDERWKNTPVVALSSHTTQNDFDRGRDVGFSDYVAKFDRDSLMNSLSRTLATAGYGK